MLKQVSFGAVIASAIIALVVQVILNMVGLGIGLSTVDAVAGDSPSVEFLVTWGRSLVGHLWNCRGRYRGYLAGRLSGKPSSSTTAHHGLISWALSTLTIVYLPSWAA